jgi:spore coat polysaccharide biosynthesis protein SpsF
MRTVAIIQARMGSTRLPGKVLMPLVGKPVLWHIVHRLRNCSSLNTIAVATSTNPSDDPIVEFALREGIKVVRGPEDNVLARYALAAERLGADIIVRVTGDAPLVDSAMLDRMVERLIESGADYCAGDPQFPCIHEGFDPFTFRALRKLVHEAGDDPVAREHVTAYFKKHPGFVHVAYVPIDPEYHFNGARISVDTPADLEFLEEVYTRLNVPAGAADVRDVVRLLRSEPDLLKINAHIHRKGADEPSRRILMRCDGDTQVGLGHVYRCLALADELREGHGCGVTFAMARGPVGFELVQQAGYPIEHKPDDRDEDFWLDHVVQRLRPDALVLDVRSDLALSNVEGWRSSGLLVVTLDDSSERRLAVDLAFYPPVPQLRRMDWAGFTGQLYVGWEWVVLRREFAQRPPQKPHERPVVLVTMGGSDPAGLTLKAIGALDLLNEGFETVVALGPGFCHHEALRDLLARTRRHFDVRQNVSDMPDLMAQADLAVASFGVTAYELAAMGVPAIYLCLTEDHTESASLFVDTGMAVCLGMSTQVTETMLAEVVGQLLNDVSSRLCMVDHVGNLVDGRGAERIARIAIARLKSAYA